MICCRWPKMNESLATMSAPARTWTTFCKGCVDVTLRGCFHNHQIQSEGTSRRLNARQLGADGNCIIRIDEQCDHGGLGHELVQQMQVLRRQCVDEEVHPCNIATWSVEADDQTGLDRIGTARKDDWNRGSSRHGCRSRSIVHDQDGYLPPEQVSRQCWQAIILSLRPPIFDRDVLADDMAGFFQALDKAVPGMCEGVR